MLSDPSLQIPIFAAVLFLVLAHPRTFAFMDDKLGGLLKADLVGDNDRPTRLGLLLHAAVFLLLTLAFLKTYDIVSGSPSFGTY